MSAVQKGRLQLAIPQGSWPAWLQMHAMQFMQLWGMHILPICHVKSLRHLSAPHPVHRYAVVVDFYVVLTGVDLDDVVVRVSACCALSAGCSSASAGHW